MVLTPPLYTRFPYTTLFRSTGNSATELHPSGRSRISPTCADTSGRGARSRSRRPGGTTCFSQAHRELERAPRPLVSDRKSTRLNSSHVEISYAVFCLKKKRK